VKIWSLKGLAPEGEGTSVGGEYQHHYYVNQFEPNKWRVTPKRSGVGGTRCKSMVKYSFLFFCPCDTQKIPTGYMGLKSIKKREIRHALCLVGIFRGQISLHNVPTIYTEKHFKMFFVNHFKTDQSILRVSN
jgi:hypothetical protein